MCRAGQRNQKALLRRLLANIEAQLELKADDIGITLFKTQKDNWKIQRASGGRTQTRLQH
ncbi:tautomerase family protein [Cyanobium sp. Morenito 9A2]|uniref:tautomerase family protein n=1 Tax=Cyanobium sp. Morenito 9A2 TaxID=2823718 RepID=UPI0037C14B5C